MKHKKKEHTKKRMEEIKHGEKLEKKKLAPKLKKAKKETKVQKVMEEFKHGELHSGSKKGPKVTNRKQAIAIALSEARKSNKKIVRKKKK